MYYPLTAACGSFFVLTSFYIHNTTMNKPKSTSTRAATHSENKKQKSDILRSELWGSIYASYGETGTDENKRECLRLISAYLKQEASKQAPFKDYNLLILYDPTILIKADADKIYNAVRTFKDKKPLLLTLYSRGGDGGSAYLIGKLCREYGNGKFAVTVPRYAKSAATMICCAAEEIHMGSLSELGPIDPQIDDLPALGLKYSIEHIAELVKKYPESGEMFARFLHRSLKLINLGYYERVAESAAQYAEKLLSTHKELLPKAEAKIAYELVYKYKDHGFVIDKTEAEEIFGKQIIKNNTPEYQLGNDLYMALSLISTFLGYMKHNFYFIGSLDSEPHVSKQPQ